MRRFIILIAAIVLVAGMLSARALLRQEARLVIANESDAVITDLRVKIWHYDIAVGTLHPGQKIEVKIGEYSDSAWQISGRWSDGSLLREQAGYITGGMSFDDRAVFGRDRKLVFSSAPR